MATLTLIRGLPGSGKSTLAQAVCNGVEAGISIHYEADMFFEDEDGRYTFDGQQIGEAHEWCQESTRQSLANGLNVVVSNTFTTLREMQPYLDMKYDKLQIIECKGNFGSIHDVPAAAVERMKARWEGYK